MALLLLVLCSGCAIPIQEESFYTDKGPDGAVITHFFDPSYQDISKAAWDSMREGMVCMSASAIGDLKAEIEQLCSRTACDEKTVQTFREAFARVHDVQLELQLTAAQRP